MMQAIHNPSSTLPSLSGLSWLETTYTHLRHHPSLDDACTYYAETFMQAFNFPYLTKIISTEPRRFACDSVLYRYYQKRVDTGSEGLMQLSKMADITPSHIDGRQRIFTLTERGLKTVSHLREAALVPLDRLNNAQRSNLDHDDYAFIARLHKMYVAVEAGGGMEGIFPQLKHILSRTAANEVLHTLWLSALREGRATPGLIQYPYRPEGKKLGVSRAHIFRLMTSLAQQQLITLVDAGGRGVFINPAFLDFYRSYASARLALSQSAYLRTRGE